MTNNIIKKNGSFSYIVGIANKAPKDSPFNFVNWELKDWPLLYHTEKDNAIFLPYNQKKNYLPQIMIFRNFPQKLNLSQVKIKLLSEPFELREDIRLLTQTAFKKLVSVLGKVYNDLNLRLLNVIEDANNLVLTVQPVRYLDYIHTNLILDAKTKNQKKSLREYIHSNGSLEPLIQSPLGNNLGINILIFTSDGNLIIQQRPQNVAFRRGELCSSASGTFSMEDISGILTLQDINLFREAYEEIGLETLYARKSDTIFLGITRELIRGGEPEMFLFAKTNLSKEDFIERWKKWKKNKIKRMKSMEDESVNLKFIEFGNLAFEPLNSRKIKQKFLKHVDSITNKIIKNSSITLLANFSLWIHYRLTENSKTK